ncbi:hypothetical protein CLU79DRAFT_490661 [Phycomyces nitens]|nr:hypothetical protein CLU79DRAFT_490661 [Phycomyces nitens]
MMRTFGRYPSQMNVDKSVIASVFQIVHNEKQSIADNYLVRMLFLASGNNAPIR